MIVSALLTSVGINLAVSALLFALYSVLRKQPGNARVYFSRHIAHANLKAKAAQPSSTVSGGLTFDRFLPSAYWLRGAWLPSEDDLLRTAGLDAVVFMRIFVFSLRVFVAAGIIGVFVLLPVNYEGNQLKNFDIFNIPNESLDKFSISNVKDGSKCA